MFVCNICSKEFSKKTAYGGHKSTHSRGDSYREKRNGRGIGLKRRLAGERTHSACPYCSEIFNKKSLCAHVPRCLSNPNYEINSKKFKGIGNKIKGLKRSEEIRKNMSLKMKQAHKEGRAWNIGKSRWNNKKSYPEIFFEKVINNEFEDKNYKTEYPVGIYSLDFAWPHKKKYIEIDGQQHKRFESYKERDIRKDKFLLENGWKVLRIKWAHMCLDTKMLISYANQFIDGCLSDSDFKAINESIKKKSLQLIERKKILNRISKNIRKQHKNDTIEELRELLKQIDIQKQKFKDDIESKKLLILNSSIDFSKYGWVKEISKLIGMKHQTINKFMKNHFPDILERSFHRR